MYGAITGDVIGSVYEFHNIKSKKFELIGANSFYTDDTICTVATADAILNNADPVQTLRYWCHKYPHAGYGLKFLDWLHQTKEPFLPYNSFGNGAAMRISPVIMAAKNLTEALELSDRYTEITHNHPEGIKGARAVALAGFMAKEDYSMSMIKKTIEDNFQYNFSRSVDQIRENYYFNETCQETVPQAIQCFLEGKSFEDAIRNAISIGGDSDTIGAITGSLAEVRWGIPEEILIKIQSKIPADMLEVATKFYEKFIPNNSCEL